MVNQFKKFFKKIIIVHNQSSFTLTFGPHKGLLLLLLLLLLLIILILVLCIVRDSVVSH